MPLALAQLVYRSFAADKLVRAFPPRRLTGRKRAVHDFHESAGPAPTGTIECTRWSAGPLPESFAPLPCAVAVVPGWFEYDPPATDDAHEWHLNFASSVAFATYPLALLAQDEMQVLEHPALMSLYEAMCAEGEVPRTVENRQPTPVLVRGVERRLELDTAPDRAAGRPHGLYGNAFEGSPVRVILDAIRLLEPPSRSNILAIEAPTGGRGSYRQDEIEFILKTAWAGFAAARAVAGAPVVIHTGYWGCGAYGGDRVLMTLLQVVAAHAAGVERVVIHAGNDASAAEEGAARAARLLAGTPAAHSTGELIERAHGHGFEWGIGNGT